MGDTIILQLWNRELGGRNQMTMNQLDGQICDMLGIPQHKSAWAKIVEGRDDEDVDGFGIDWYNTICKMLSQGHTVEEIRGMNLTERGRKVLDFLDSRFTFKTVEI